MKLSDIAKLLDAEIFCGHEKATLEISSVCAGDLMSDILFYAQPHSLLVTGLVNLQVIRTAEMLDIAGIMFIKGKVPSQDMLALASESGIPLLSTGKTMYSSCGLLYTAGL